MIMAVHLQNLGSLGPSGVPQMAHETRLERHDTFLERVRPGPFWIAMNPKSIIGDIYDLGACL